MKLGTAVIEEILCRPGAGPSVDTLLQAPADAWERSYPSLSSLPALRGAKRPIRICIATEDVVGPVRNGGIGTTYAALAEVLVQAGYDLTLLYLKGFEVENETIDYWIEHYRRKRISFVPVSNYARQDRFPQGGDRWAQYSYNMMRFLLDNHMDVVHVSEWRGSGYLSLLAKRQGLAFDKTLFVVKASSPWLWNRLYGLQPFERLEDLARVQAERCSIEMADLVVGGSAHLLRWMHSQGYCLPEGRTFVQPNVVSVPPAPPGPAPARGQRVPISEFVFFGRLEARKGLLLFIHAVKRMIRQGHALPARITFLGKPGALLLEQPGEQVVDVIKAETAGWPCDTEILSDLQQSEALTYLQGEGRLAVMPSTIENSSLAVYEALVSGIPFVASDVGGNPELVHPEDTSRVLCPAHPIPLAEKLTQVMDEGAYVARASFDNAANLEDWRTFHASLGAGLLEKLQRPRTMAQDVPTISVCLYHTESSEKLQASLASLQEQTVPPLEVLVAIDSGAQEAVAEAEAMASAFPFKTVVLPAFDLDAGPAFNLLVDKSRGQYCFLTWTGSTLYPDALERFGNVLGATGADIASCLHRVRLKVDDGEQVHLNSELIGGVAESFFHSDLTPVPLLARRSAFHSLSGFATDYRSLGYDHELISRAALAGFKCETVLQELCTVDGWDDERLRRLGYSRSASEFRCSRALLAAAPLALREALLMAKGVQKALGRRGRLGGPPPVRRPTAPPPRRMLLSRIPLPSLVPPPAAPPEKKPTRRAGAFASPRTSGAQIRSEPQEHEISHWQAESGAQYSGAILGVHNGVIFGWVRAEEDYTKSLEVEAEFGGRRRRTFRADGAHRFALQVRQDETRHTFAIPVWNRPAALRLNWQSRNVTLRIVGSDIIIARLAIPASPYALEAFGFDGYCDIVDNRLRGWVWQPTSPERAIDVAAFIDGKFLAKATANTHRDDLRAQGIGTGAHGFAIPIPRIFRTGKLHRVDVVVAEVGTLLRKGEMFLQGDVLRLRKPRVKVL